MSNFSPFLPPLISSYLLHSHQSNSVSLKPRHTSLHNVFRLIMQNIMAITSLMFYEDLLLHLLALGMVGQPLYTTVELS